MSTIWLLWASLYPGISILILVEKALGRGPAAEKRRPTEAQGLKTGKKRERGSRRSSVAFQSGTDTGAIVNWILTATEDQDRNLGEQGVSQVEGYSRLRSGDHATVVLRPSVPSYFYENEQRAVLWSTKCCVVCPVKAKLHLGPYALGKAAIIKILPSPMRG